MAWNGGKNREGKMAFARVNRTYRLQDMNIKKSAGLSLAQLK